MSRARAREKRRSSLENFEEAVTSSSEVGSTREKEEREEREIYIETERTP